MAGLLDYVIGDDEKKDEYGQTQADRRMPIWSGMINSGLLMLAGGQRMMPEERAQYIAKIGGALGGIPEQMMAQKSELAKQALQRQQIDASKQQVEIGKQTLATGAFTLAQKKAMQDMVSSPDFQAKFNSVSDPAVRALVQSAIVGGHYDVAIKALIDADKLVPVPGGGLYNKQTGEYLDTYTGTWKKPGSEGAPPPPGATPPPAATPPPVVTPPPPQPDVPRGPGGNVVLPPLVPGGTPYGGSTAPPPPPPAIVAPPPAPPAVPPGPTATPAPAPIVPGLPQPPQMSVAPPGSMPNPRGRQTHRPFPGATSPLDDGTDPNVQLAQATLQAQPFRNRAQQPSQVPGAPVAPPTPGAPVLPPPGGAPAPPPAPSPAVAQEAGGAPMPKPAGVPLPTNPNLNMEAFAKVPDKWKPIVMAWIEGTKELPVSIGSRNSEVQRALADAYKVDPSLNNWTNKNRVEWMQGLASTKTSGVGQTIRTVNTFLNHAGHFEDTAAKLDLDSGFRANFTNPAKIAEMRANRDPRLAAFEAAVDPVLEEFAGIMKPSGLTDAQIKIYQDKLTKAQTPEERHAALNVMVKLMHGRLDPIAEQHAQIMGHPAGPNQFIFPQGQQQIERLKSLADADEAARAQKGQSLPTITTKEAYDKLPPGAGFIGSDGKPWVKPK